MLKKKFDAMQIYTKGRNKIVMDPIELDKFRRKQEERDISARRTQKFINHPTEIMKIKEGKSANYLSKQGSPSKYLT